METRIVIRSSGEKKITYHSYMHILYVAKPIDKDFQSLNFSVPVMIDDVTIDATNAPILFSIGIDCYEMAQAITIHYKQLWLTWPQAWRTGIRL